jgi:hypothetical protein
MSQQVNFYVSPTETAALEEAWRSLGSMSVLHSRSNDAGPRVLPSSDLEEAGQRWLFFQLVRTDDLKSVVMRNVPAQGYWTVDVVKSPVVELTRCFFDGRILRRGRLYFVDGFYGADGEWVDKGEDFKKWGKSLLSATKKKLARHESDYIGEEARSWLESSGGSLVS